MQVQPSLLPSQLPCSESGFKHIYVEWVTGMELHSLHSICGAEIAFTLLGEN